MPNPPTARARPDPSLAARVVRSVPLLYAAGADPSLDRPAHVRAASGMARVGDRVAVRLRLLSRLTPVAAKP